MTNEEWNELLKKASPAQFDDQGCLKEDQPRCPHCEAAIDPQHDQEALEQARRTGLGAVLCQSCGEWVYRLDADRVAEKFTVKH